MTKHVMSITYPPKIPAVLDGRCRQTIRKGRRFKVGDEILLHGWEGKPYRSKWSWRKRVIAEEVFDILIDDETITFAGSIDDMTYAWGGIMSDLIAVEDYIDPPTGEALRDVLFGLNGTPTEPTEYQIIRWTDKEIE